MIPENPRILVTNDDGADAPGLQVLHRIAKTISDDVWIVAPRFEQSGASRGISLHDPLRIRKMGERHYSVSGTPTDCVMLAVGSILEDRPPDLVLSGVNRGQNLAEHVTLSGTIAGAIQGMELGFPAVALSQTMNYETGAPIQWETAEAHGPAILKRLLKAGWPENVLININFPDAAPQAVNEVEVTSVGRRDRTLLDIDRRQDPAGRDYYWLGFAGKLSEPGEETDLKAIAEGRISVTPLHMDLTHHETRGKLTEVLGGSIPKG